LSEELVRTDKLFRMDNLSFTDKRSRYLQCETRSTPNAKSRLLRNYPTDHLYLWGVNREDFTPSFLYGTLLHKINLWFKRSFGSSGTKAPLSRIFLFFLFLCYKEISPYSSTPNKKLYLQVERPSRISIRSRITAVCETLQAYFAK
jgi:hypothetical protein